MNDLVDVSLATSGPSGYRPVVQAFYKLFSDRFVAVGGRIGILDHGSNIPAPTEFADIDGGSGLGGGLPSLPQETPVPHIPQEPSLGPVKPAGDVGSSLGGVGVTEFDGESDRNSTIVDAGLPTVVEPVRGFQSLRPSFRDKLVVFGISFYYVIYFYLLFHFFL